MKTLWFGFCFFCLLTLCLSITACGGDDDADEGTTPPSGDATPTPTPTPTPTMTTRPTPDPQNAWTLVWSDEFDGATIDDANWSFEVNCWGGGNNEQQCYTDRSDNAFVDEGLLNILAKREDFTGPATPDGSPGANATLPYTSARLRTMNKGDWTYGRFEIRAKMPQGQGTWPAIWMLPTDYVYGGWAASGEIDIVEAVNLKTPSDEAGVPDGTQEARVHGTLHYGSSWPENVNSGTDYKLPEQANPADDFHIYAVEWEEGEIRWYVDNVHYATQREDGWYSRYDDGSGNKVIGPIGAPFNQNFHLILNLAVGGAWAGNTNEGGIEEASFPQILQVDWVRVYECSVSPSTGAGCATIDENAEIVEGNAPPIIVDPSDDYGSGPLYTLYNDGPTENLEIQSYNPDGAVVFDNVPDAERGTVLAIEKAGPNGNTYFNYSPRVNLSDFDGDGELIFDVKLVSIEDGVTVLVKIDSGWPNVSDTEISLPALGQWMEIRLNVADLIAQGNSLADGRANISEVLNPFVIEPSGIINLKLDNIRYEAGDDSSPPNTKSQIDLPVTFEDANVDYSLVDFGGTFSAIDIDPAGGESMVAKTTKTSGAVLWAGTTIGTVDGFATPIPVTPENSIMKVWVYSPDQNIPVRLKLEDHNDPSRSVETDTLTRTANEWEEMAFDFNNEVAGTEPLSHPEWVYDKASIFFNFGTNGADAGEKIYYWDDVSFGE